MATVTLQYLNVFRQRTAAGQAVAYYRRGGQRWRLTGPDGEPVDPSDRVALMAAWAERHAAYEAAQAKAAGVAAARTVVPRSIGDLIARYRASAEWAAHAPATRLDYEKGLRPLERDWGSKPVVGLQRHHISKIRDRYAWREKPDPEHPGKTLRVANIRQANRVVTVLSIIMSYAADNLGWRNDNPALRPKRLKSESDGYRPWLQVEFRQFWERSDPEWQFAALLALLTAQRSQDQVTMTWSDYDGSAVHVVQKKGRRMVRLWVPCHPLLRDALDRRRAKLAAATTVPLNGLDTRTIMVRPDGRPWEVNAFQKAAGKAIRAAGLEGIVWHGLRGAAASWAAEGNASDAAIAAWLGQRQTQTTRHYSRGAAESRLAEQAIAAVTVPVELKQVDC